MKRVIASFCLIGIIICSCNNSNDEKKLTPPVSDNIIISDHDSLENFNAFFKRFKEDSTFQIERIKFPLESEYSEQTSRNFKLKKKFINSKDWKFDTFQWDSSYAKRETDAYNQRVKSSGDTTKVLWEGVSNGINIELAFILVDKKWYLLKYSDYSM